MGIPDHLTCLLRNLYAGHEATVWTGHGITDWFQIGKGVCQGCILSPCLFNLYAEYITRNAGLEEAQAGIKIAGKNINNLRYADDTTLRAESEEELRESWWNWKRRVKKLAWNFSSVQSLSCVRLFVTQWTAAHQVSLSTTNSHSSPKPMSIESVMPSSHLILCCPLPLPSIFRSIRVFSNESALCIRWPKYRSFSFSISPSIEYLGLISFRMDWLDLLAVQGTLKSLQYHSSKASILRHSAFFAVQLSYPSMTAGKTIALIRLTLSVPNSVPFCSRTEREKGWS